MERRSTNRRPQVIIAILTIAIVVAGLVTRLAHQRGQGDEGPAWRERVQLSEQVKKFTESLVPNGRYRHPTAREQRIAASGIGMLLNDVSNADQAARHLSTLGFSAYRAVDEATGRPCILIVNEPDSARSWGMYIVDLSAPARLAIEVPHPNSDLRTEELGLSMFRRVPGSVLLIAGAHRDAADKAADVAHQENSTFNAVATEFAERDLPQVQLHGFHDKSLPGRDIVISAGSAEENELAERVGEQMNWAWFSVCSAARERCGQLEGTRNAQGRTAAKLSSPYVHIEVSRSVREVGQRREALSEVIASALLS